MDDLAPSGERSVVSMIGLISSRVGHFGRLTRRWQHQQSSSPSLAPLCSSPPLHVARRTCDALLFGGQVSTDLIDCSYQLFIVLPASGDVLGIPQRKGHTEPEWDVDPWLTVI